MNPTPIGKIPAEVPGMGGDLESHCCITEERIEEGKMSSYTEEAKSSCLGG
jgi:hypothetical protein